MLGGVHPIVHRILHRLLTAGEVLSESGRKAAAVAVLLVDRGIARTFHALLGSLAFRGFVAEKSAGIHIFGIFLSGDAENSVKDKRIFSHSGTLRIHCAQHSFFERLKMRIRAAYGSLLHTLRAVDEAALAHYALLDCTPPHALGDFLFFRLRAPLLEARLELGGTPMVCASLLFPLCALAFRKPLEFLFAVDEIGGIGGPGGSRSGETKENEENEEAGKGAYGRMVE